MLCRSVTHQFSKFLHKCARQCTQTRQNDFLQRTCGREFIFSCVQRQRGRFRLIHVTDTKFRHHQSTAVRLDEHVRTALPTDSQSQNDCCTGCQCDRLIIITSPPWVGANQCNQRVCLSVCLSHCSRV